MSIKKAVKSLLNKEGVIRLENLLNPRNHVRIGKTNKLDNHGAMLRGIDILIRGTNNRIVIEAGAVLKSCVIRIYGNDNEIRIGNSCLIRCGTFWIEDNENYIHIGRNTTVNGKTEFAAIEGTKIDIGNDCMFSSGITLRTGDSHNIIDSNGKRINRSDDIIIGNHVWLCAEAMLLKGTRIESNSIVGARAVVTKSFESNNVMIAGCPAKVIKSEINWERERI